MLRIYTLTVNNVKPTITKNHKEQKDFIFFYCYKNKRSNEM